MRPARVVLLDVDGTLVDSTVVHALCWHEALRAHGYVVPATQLHHAIGMGSRRVLDHALDPERDRSHDDAMIEAHRVLYRLYWDRLAVLPGAVDLLRACKKAGSTVVLASSAAADELAMLRRVLDADELIDADTDASDVEETKPASDPIHVALDRVNARPGDALFIGDAVWDGIAARDAGVIFAGVTCGAASADQLWEVGALEVASTPGELATRLA